MSLTSRLALASCILGLLWLVPVWGQAGSSEPQSPGASINTVKYDTLASLTGIFPTPAPTPSAQVQAAVLQNAMSSIDVEPRDNVQPQPPHYPVPTEGGVPQTNNLAARTVNAFLTDQKPVQNATPIGFKAIDGLNQADQQSAGTGFYGSNQPSIDPADGALCVGAGFVLQAVNLALTVFDYSSNQLIPPVALNQFFKRSTYYYDPLSDPQCLFDRDTQRFFLTIYYSTIDRNTGRVDYAKGTGILMAVSQTSNPLAGWHLYIQPTTNNGSGGTPNITGCPCLADQPYVAANAYAVTTSTNLYSETSFVGSMLYVASKYALAAGAPAVLTAAFLPEQLGVPGTDYTVYSYQPTKQSVDNPYETSNGGVQYLVASLNLYCNGPVSNLGLYAILNTIAVVNASSASALSQLQLVATVIDTAGVTYDNCNASSSILGNNLGLPATQKDGPHRFGTQVEVLDSGDDRVVQPVYANSRIWVGINTALVGASSSRLGIAYYVLFPSVTTTSVTAQVENAGVLSTTGNNSVFYPAFAVNKYGQGVLGFSLSGPDFYPSAAFVVIAQSQNTIIQSDIVVAKAGVAPQDAYTAPSNSTEAQVSRWGDYFMGAADEDSNVWYEVTYIPARPRYYYENWGTAIVKVPASSISLAPPSVPVAPAPAPVAPAPVPATPTPAPVSETPAPAPVAPTPTPSFALAPAPATAPPVNPTTGPPVNPTTAPPVNVPTTAPPVNPTTAPPVNPTTAPPGTPTPTVGVFDAGGTCDAFSANPNQCFNADGSKYTCCPSGVSCSSPPTDIPGCVGIPTATVAPTTAAPVATTSAPVATTAAPVPTTAAPVSTTAAPGATTSAPVSTTAAPVSTTAAPAATTAAPGATTSAPVSTTAAPVVTTAAPVSTTATPVATTAAPGTTSPTTPPATTAFPSNVCDPYSAKPNQCFNAGGTSFICCAGSCPSSPTDVAICGF